MFQCSKQGFGQISKYLLFWAFGFLSFEFVSDFDIRYSDLAYTGRWEDLVGGAAFSELGFALRLAVVFGQHNPGPVDILVDLG